MRTNIVLNDQLLEEAFRYAGVTTKRELIDLALREFVANHSRHNIKQLKDKVQLSPDYNYKALRKNRDHGF